MNVDLLWLFCLGLRDKMNETMEVEVITILDTSDEVTILLYHYSTFFSGHQEWNRYVD